MRRTDTRRLTPEAQDDLRRRVVYPVREVGMAKSVAARTSGVPSVDRQPAGPGRRGRVGSGAGRPRAGADAPAAAGQIELVYRPGYDPTELVEVRPEPNPDELLNQDTKQAMKKCWRPTSGR